MLGRHTYAHMHRDENFPWMYVFSIMYCRSVSWEASIGARGLCEEMELWDRAPVDGSSATHLKLQVCWVTDSPACWMSPKPERDLSQKTRQMAPKEPHLRLPCTCTWTNTPAHREKVLISPITGACLLCDHPAFRMAKIKFLFFMVFCHAACMDRLSPFNSDCSQYLDKHPLHILV